MQIKILAYQRGFTLIEIMVVVVIVAIFAAIAIPSYQEYVRRSQAAQAQQEIQRIATELERWKSRNFSYLGYNLAAKNVTNYTFQIRDGQTPANELDAGNVTGVSWVIRAVSSDANNFTFLLTSADLRCKNKTSLNIVVTDATAVNCGSGGEGVW